MTDLFETNDDKPTQPVKRGRGRPTGARDRYPRYVAQQRLLSKTTYGHLLDIVRLAPKGRELDKVGMLRAALTAILGRIVSEIENDEEGSVRRRESLCAAFRILHTAELETVKLLPDMATDITGRAVPAGMGSPGNLIHLHMPDFQRRPVDGDDD